MINHVRLRSSIFAFALFTMVSALNSRAVAEDHSHPQSATMTQSAESAQFQKEMDAGMGKMMSDMHATGYSGNADADFLSMMIPHHEGAVEMARLELTYGRDPLTRKLAEEIIAGQQVEIEAMKRRLAILRNRHELGKEEFPPLGGTRGISGQGSDSKIKPEKYTNGHATALGKPGNPEKVTRSIQVEMNDTMRFKPASIKVKRGETIRFIVRNAGKVKHEMVLGTLKELKEHAELMRKFPEMKHADPNQVSVEPGKTGELIWQFTNTGTFDFACLVPGHFEAGMVGKIRVTH